MNYKLSISKSKRSRTFYIQTSYREGATVRTKTVKRLGNESFIKENHGVEDAEAWAREELARMRRAAEEEKQGLVLELRPDKLTDNTERIFNGGDVFVEKVATSLGLREICNRINSNSTSATICCEWSRVVFCIPGRSFPISQTARDILRIRNLSWKISIAVSTSWQKKWTQCRE